MNSTRVINLKVKVDMPVFLFKAFFYVLCFLPVYSYIGMEWQQYDSGIQAVTMITRTDLIVRLCVMIILFLPFVIIFLERNFPLNVISICSLTLLISGFFWSVLAFLSHGKSFIYINGTPLTFIQFGIIMLLSQKEKYWKIVLQSLFPISIGFTVLSFIYAIDMTIQFPFYRMGPGPVLTFFAIALFSSAVLLVNGRIQFPHDKFFMAIPIILIVVGMITTSRGWTAQAVLLLLGSYFFKSSKSVKDKLKHILLCTAAIGIVIWLASTVFEDALTFIIARLGVNSRSSQYETFFDQIKPYKLLIGQGVDAKYILNGRPYAYFDNQFIFLSFRYGLIPMLAYTIPFIMIMGVYMKPKYKVISNQYILVTVMWLLALLGLSVYNDVCLNLQNLIVLMTVSHFAVELKEISKE